jgi:hypothetical protein
MQRTMQEMMAMNNLMKGVDKNQTNKK